MTTPKLSHPVIKTQPSKICPVCGKTFFKKKTESNFNWIGRRRFCSKTCAKTIKIEDQPSKICKSCDQVFFKPSKFALKIWEKRRYCNPCLNARKSKNQLPKICPICGKTFYKKMLESFEEWLTKRYCSPLCADKGKTISLLSTAEQLKQIWSQTTETDSGCWEFNGHSDRCEYGRVTRSGKKVSVHRYIYELIYGPIPDGLHVLHKCDFPPCCNPEHLFLGDSQDNSSDMVAKGRSQTGEKHHGARLTEDQVRLIKKDHRFLMDIAKDYHVTKSTICSIKSGKTWKHLNHKKEVI